MSYVSLKRNTQTLKFGQQVKTKRFQISGNAPFVQSFTEIKEKPK